MAPAKIALINKNGSQLRDWLPGAKKLGVAPRGKQKLSYERASFRA
jgi:hypothetical protein